MLFGQNSNHKTLVRIYGLKKKSTFTESYKRGHMNRQIARFTKPYYSEAKKKIHNEKSYSLLYFHVASKTPNMMKRSIRACSWIFGTIIMRCLSASWRSDDVLLVLLTLSRHFVGFFRFGVLHRRRWTCDGQDWTCCIIFIIFLFFSRESRFGIYFVYSVLKNS